MRIITGPDSRPATLAEFAQIAQQDHRARKLLRAAHGRRVRVAPMGAQGVYVGDLRTETERTERNKRHRARERAINDQRIQDRKAAA